MKPFHGPWARAIRGGRRALGLGLLAGAWCLSASAATLQLVARDGQARPVATEQLARQAEARVVEIAADPSYKRPMRYRAVPLAPLLQSLGVTAADTVEVVADDGFVAQLPGALLLRQEAGQARAWLAFETVDAPWPALPGKAGSAGAFYIVWSPDAGVRSEQWPYNVARLAVKDAPARRWPQLAVAETLPPQDLARWGQSVFITQCLVCHRLNGGGESQLGPDLNWPLAPTEYFQPTALRQLIRNPASVRSWPQQAMPGFGPDQLSERDLDALLAYFGHMAGRKVAPPRP